MQLLIACMGMLVILTPHEARAKNLLLSQQVEAILTPNIGGSWDIIDLVNTYTAPVIACTYTLPSNASNPATIRMRNAGTNSFEIKAQQFENSSAVTASQVHCLVVETGVHTLPGGQEIEAHTVISDETSGQALGWGLSQIEDVTATLGHSYSSLVAIGQVMTSDDARASVFWTNNCTGRGAPPTPARICVGKHIGQINSTRNNETIGFITMEAGTGTANDVAYAFARGPDAVDGVNNGPSTYAVSGDFDIGVVSQAAEDGGQGGWAVLYGANPLPNNQIRLGIDEETVAGDISRSHTDEEVFYAVFADNQASNVVASKTVAPAPSNPSGYALPDTELIYTLNISNDGPAVVEKDTLFLVDSLPNDVIFQNIDIAGPGSGPVSFSAGASGLTFDTASDVTYSSAASAPSTPSDCNYTPTGSADANIRHICLRPKGFFRPETIYPGSDISFDFIVTLK